MKYHAIKPNREENIFVTKRIVSLQELELKLGLHTDL